MLLNFRLVVDLIQITAKPMDYLTLAILGCFSLKMCLFPRDLAIFWVVLAKVLKMLGLLNFRGLV